MTHTYVVLNISPAAYAEIREKLKAAGYEHAFHEQVHEVTRGGRHEGDVTNEVIDMQGLAIRADEDEAPADTEADGDYGGGGGGSTGGGGGGGPVR